MINLMPPTLKESIRFAKLNRMMLGYVRMAGTVAVVLAVIFGGAWYLMEQQSAAVKVDVADKQATIASLNKTFVPKAKDASDRLAAIKYVQASQTKFSAVIEDIAKVVPTGVSVDSFTLTGVETAPVKISFTAKNYQAALAFRNALTTSPRVAAADLETISANANGTFQTSVVIGFKKGQAR